MRDVTFGQMEKGDRADNTAEDGRQTLEPTLDGRPPPLTYVREGGEGCLKRRLRRRRRGHAVGLEALIDVQHRDGMGERGRVGSFLSSRGGAGWGSIKQGLRWHKHLT